MMTKDSDLCPYMDVMNPMSPEALLIFIFIPAQQIWVQRSPSAR
jgi:hypothetical protein